MSEFSERLKELRKAANITQTQLADKLNLHPQTVSKWERGLSEPDISQLGEIAAALGITMEKLCGQAEAEQTFIGDFHVEQLGKMISEQRIARNESQEQLASFMQTSTDAVSRWERGVTCPDVAKLIALADHFALPVSRLWCGIGEEQSTESVAVAQKRHRMSVAIAAAAIMVCLTVILLAILLPRGQASAQSQVYMVSVDGEEVSVPEGTWYMPETPLREGYDFVGWRDAQGEMVTFPCAVTEDMAVEAVFAPHEYTIDYWLNGGFFRGSVTTSITLESGSVELAVPEKSGDTFEGWYLTPDYSGEAVERISCTGTNLSLYAKWSNAVYSIRYELGGGILYESNPASVTAETECLLHEPVREGYLFLGWYDGAQGGTKYDRVGGDNAANVTLYALWQKSDALFSVLYDYMGGEAMGENPVSVGVGEVYELLPASKAGYTFLGWNTQKDGSGEYVSRLYNVDEMLYLYAIFEPKTYVVRYIFEGNYEGDATNPNMVEFGERVTLLPVALYGHEFVGWYDAEEGGNPVAVIDASNILTITTLYARFVPLEFQLHLDAGDGTFTSPDGEASVYTYQVQYGQSLDLPTCSREGYAFLGWMDEDGNPVEQITSVNLGDMSLTASWMQTGVEYRIEYMLDGGAMEGNPETALSDVTVSLNEPVREGYLFLGWYDNPNGVGEPYLSTPFGRTEDLTLYALWQEMTISGSVEFFDYEKTSSEVTITDYHGPTGANVDVIIPSVVDGLPVTRIGSNRTYLDGEILVLCSIFGEPGAAEIRSLTIPEGVVVLEENAFRTLKVAQPLQLPSTLERIEAGVFDDYGGEVLFSDGGNLTYIGESAFKGVRFIGTLVIPHGVKDIERHAFYGVKVSGIILPDTVETIHEGAFCELYAYSTKMYVPASVTYIGAGGVEAGQVYTTLSEEQVSNLPFGCGRVVMYNVQASTITLCDGGTRQTLTGEAFDLPSPQKAGYTFLGWQDENGEFVGDCYIPNRNATLTAVYEKQSEHDGRTLGSAAVLEADETYQFTLLDGRVFYFRPDFSQTCRIMISVNGDFRWTLCRIRGNVMETIWQSGDPIDFRAGDVFYVVPDPIPAGTEMTVIIILLSD